LCVAEPPAKPEWDRLFETAGAQDGYFTTRQAADAGYSTQLLLKHIRAGRVARMRRGIYRLVHFPAGEHEELVIVWLWSGHAGVISHQTALALHELSDVLPAHVHLTLPSAWCRRRFRVPAGVVLHYADVPPGDRTWFGAVPTTNPRRSLNDCAREGLSPELLRHAAQQALHRGLVTKTELGGVDEALEPFGGLAS
jgi:predicted transcriptional regulator of viral defense system